MKRKLSITLSSLFLALMVKGQDPHYTQRFVNPMFTQPALTGIQGVAAVGGQYRDQWSGTYKPATIFYSQHLDFLHGGVGVQVVNDRQGTANGLIANSINLTYAPVFKLSNEVDFRAGLQAGFEHRSQSVVPDSMYKTQMAFPDFSAGFAFTSEYLYGGASVFHLTKPKVSFGVDGTHRLYRRGDINLGGFIPLQDMERGWLLAPFLSHRSHLGLHPANMYLLGCGVSKGMFAGGISHRGSLGAKNSGVINAMFGVNLKQFKIGYSYDLDNMGPIYENSHELSLVVYLGKKKDSNPVTADYFRRML